MQPTQQKQIELNHFFQLLVRKKWLIISCIIGTISPIIYYNKITLPVYEASTMIICEETKETISNISFAQSRLGNTFIVNLLQDLKTWSLANEVAKALPAEVTKTYLPEPLPSDFNTEKFLTSIIQKNISATPVHNSDVVKISAEANDAKVASILVNTVANVLKLRNLEARLGEIHNVQKTVDDQLTYFKQKVEQAEQELKNYKEKHKVTSLEQESTQILGRISAAEIEYNKVKTQHDAAQKRLNFVKNILSKEREGLIPAIISTTNPWAQKLKEKLVNLEVQYTTLKVQNYDDNHPQMKNLKSQIEETKKNLKEETIKIAMGENTIDPLSQIQQNLQEIAILEVEIHTYEAQRKALVDVLNRYKNSLKSVPEKELELGRLIRDKSVADNIYTMLLQKREEAKITKAGKMGNIRIIDPARVPRRPIKPRRTLNLLLGTIVGLTLGIGLALFLEMLSASIKTVEEVEQYTGLAVIGLIPKIRRKKRFLNNGFSKNSENRKVNYRASKLITGIEPKSPEAEAFRTLRTNIQFAGIESPLKTILVTSTNPEEGKSLVTANLGITTAQMGLRTLLIDADLRRPVLHDFFKKEIQPGLMDILFSPHEVNNKKIRNSEETLIEQQNSIFNTLRSNDDIKAFTKKSIKTTGITNLYLISCGIIPPNPSEILASKAMKELINILKNSFDIVFFDLPPILAVTDTAVLAPAIDGVIFVISSGKNKRDEILRAKSLLEKVHSNLLGVVLNNIDARGGYSSHYYYYYNKPHKKRKRK